MATLPICPQCGSQHAIGHNFWGEESGVRWRCKSCYTEYKEVFRPLKETFREMINNELLSRVWNKYAERIHNTAVEKGWWDKERNDGEMLALIHSEVSECLEALRHGNLPDDKIDKFTGAEAELADVVIRIMDMAHQRGWDIAGAIHAKVEFNESRERMHGGKRF